MRKPQDKNRTAATRQAFREAFGRFTNDVSTGMEGRTDSLYGRDVTFGKDGSFAETENAEPPILRRGRRVS